MENVVIPEFVTGWALLLWMAVTVAMPLLVGLVTRPSTPARFQTLLLVGLSIANGFLSEALEKGSAFNWGDGLMQFLVSLVMAISMHYGVWKPTGTTAAALRFGTKSDYRRAA